MRSDYAMKPKYPYFEDDPNSLGRIRKEQLIPRQHSSIARLLYSQVWRELPLAAVPAPVSGRWLVLTEHTPFCTAVVTAIRDAGADLTEVTDSCCDPYHYGGATVDPSSYEALQRLVQHESGTPLTGVISLWGDSPLANLNLVRALLAAGISPRLFLVTTAAHNPTGTEREINPHGSALWGLGASVASEAPEFSGKLLDLSLSPGKEELAALVRELAATDGEDRIALRGGRRFVSRLVRDGAQTGQARDGFHSGTIDRGMINQTGSYLVTGGLGVLGLAVAARLVDEGCRHLALMGRNAPSTDVAEAVEGLRRTGAQVVVLAGDVADTADVLRIMTELRATMPPLKGIFHAAGLLDDAMLTDMDAQKLDRVMRPKIVGAWNLHRATEQDHLELFVLFSSLTAVTGSPGQANYAAANAALDGFARWRRSRGLAAVSITWGPWGEAGLAAREGKSDRLTARGIRGLAIDAALQALGMVLRASPVEQCVADLDLQRLSSFIPTTGAGLYAEVLSQGADSSGDTATDANRLAPLGQASQAERPAMMLLLVQELAAMVMGQSDPTCIESDRPLQEQGFDSLMTVDLHNLITKTFNVELPVSLLFDYPTPEKIGRFLLEEVLAWPAADKSDSVVSVVGDMTEKTADDLVDEIEQLLRE
jgi:NAD(P)-dependent dehydrogenase (short-subunit alcohol dehydrogenase family)/acyl carrier protein